MKFENAKEIENIPDALVAIRHILKVEGYIIGAYGKEMQIGKTFGEDPLACNMQLTIIDKATREDALRHLAIVQKLTGELDMIEPPEDAFFYKMVPDLQTTGN